MKRLFIYSFYDNDGIVDDYVIFQLKSFRDEVNKGNSYSGSTITLTGNINLGNDEWTPIGNKDRSFNGVFDGSWHCVSNFKITNQEYSGLFGKTNGATISNLKISNLLLTNQQKLALMLEG